MIYLSSILFLAIIFFLLSSLIMKYNNKKQHGFLTIIPNKKNVFYPLQYEAQTFEKIVEFYKKKNGAQVYSSTEKITLTPKNDSFLIEDKNYKNSMLINRRRHRKLVLKDGDIIDMGQLVLVYINTELQSKQAQTYLDQQTNFQIGKPKHGVELIKNIPALVPKSSKENTFYLTKNIVYIGRSDMNDLCLKNKDMPQRYAKIKKIANQFKIVDITGDTNLIINGKRYTEKFLNEGDDIAFDKNSFKFSYL